MAKGLEEEMNLADFVKGKRSKQDDIPGTTEGEVDKTCPVCGRKMRRYKKCCGSPEGFIGCLPCNWKEPV
jgi:hypothetical protein